MSHLCHGPGYVSSQLASGSAPAAPPPRPAGGRTAGPPTFPPLLAPPTFIIRSRQEQHPKPAEKPLLDSVYEHFKDRPHDFEQFAADLMRLSNPNVDRIDVTRPWQIGRASC